MQNQHVVDWAAARSREADTALSRFRFPGGVIAGPYRYSARLWAHRLMLELVRQHAPHQVAACGPWTPVAFHRCGVWA